MGRYVTVSVKVPRELKEELERYGVKTSEVLRRALYEALREARVRELERRWEEVRDIFDKIPVERAVRSIREDREAR